jgi:uncharacterized membrane protein YwaF
VNALFSSVPTQFGAVHLAILGGILLLSAGLAFLLRKQPEETLARLIGVLGALMILAEIWKQWFVRRYVYPNGATWFFPWQLCSIAMYCSFLVPFLRGRARDALLTFLGSFSLLAAAVALLVPGDMLRPQIALFCHSFAYHAVMVAESIAAISILARRKKKPPFRPALVLFLATAAVSEVINVICYTFFGERTPVANMFNITPYHPSTQPIFHQIAVTLGILPEIIIYLGVIILVSWGLYRLLCARKDKAG